MLPTFDAVGITGNAVSAGGVKLNALWVGHAGIIVEDVGEVGAGIGILAELQAFIGIALIAKANKVGVKALTWQGWLITWWIFFSTRHFII